MGVLSGSRSGIISGLEDDSIFFIDILNYQIFDWKVPHNKGACYCDSEVAMPNAHLTRRMILRSAAVSVGGLGILSGQGAAAASQSDQSAQVITKDVEAGSQRVTLFGTMADFGGHEYVWAGFTYKKKGTMSGSIGEEIKLWKPDAAPAQLSADDQQGPKFSLTFEYGKEGVSKESEEWRLRPGTTYTYQAQARLPREIGSVPISGDQREFTIPCDDYNH